MRTAIWVGVNGVVLGARGKLFWVKGGGMVAVRAPEHCRGAASVLNAQWRCVCRPYTVWSAYPLQVWDTCGGVHAALQDCGRKHVFRVACIFFANVRYAVTNH